ncbi:hypothetical protein LOH54_04585 [Sulfurimonas sp. HSL-3221]|uniref:hypothetical protein n=1 Tax=Sulfurimonadaceae TaxID=2771471 RepID=UPI001E2E9CDA|nr:hypothetical protein [Sulfurimonas sp. HSL-3221]UFS63409.1 hypothetical protein LOH54_04585 [Sulfurimonas sp. HSL-3221]
MKRSTFDTLLSFLLGFAWALLLLGSWLLFHITAIFGFSIALLATIVFIFLMFCVILMLEGLNLYKDRVENQREQTRLLQRIAELLESEA